MGWPYHSLDLTHEEILIRRHLLDQYGSYAQLSALVPVLAYQLYRLAIWASSGRQRLEPEYSAVPSSPSLKNDRLRASGTFSAILRQTKWWLESEVVKGWGTRGYWLSGLCWMAWLMFLSVHRTGEGGYHILRMNDRADIQQTTCMLLSDSV